MNRILLLLLCLCAALPGGFAAPAEPDDEQLLRRLDAMIERRDVYRRAVEQRIASCQAGLKYADTDSVRFELLGKLFQQYRSFRVDTAYMVARLRLELARRMKNEANIARGTMDMADAMNKLGRYDEALLWLDRVKRTDVIKRDTHYYYLYHTTYLSRYNEETLDDRRSELFHKLKAYKDTLVSISRPGSQSYISNQCGLLSLQGRWDEAISMMTECYNRSEANHADKASMEYQLASLYWDKGDMREAKHYLILSSMTDIANAKKVYMSLQRLARLLYSEGDVKRAYAYISCSLEDVTFGKARYRMADIAKVLPIIQAAYNDRLQADRERILYLMLLLSLLIITLVVLALFLRSRNLKLTRVQQSLAEQNLQLQEMTERLIRMSNEIKESSHIKEEYIGLLFNFCSEYIGKREGDRKRLLKITKTGTMADVSKLLQEQVDAKEDFKQFIAEFDTIFLSIFPDFVASFNKLLRPEEQITPKEGELLTPELRIYALIRLGINDNSKIAGFLHYSLQTVYNYRMKMRNKALVPGKDLAQQVQKL